MSRSYFIFFLFSFIFLSSVLLNQQSVHAQDDTFSPRFYRCQKTDQKPVIDGKIDDEVWKNAEWTSSFVDIEGDKKPLPFFDTKVKMLWDEHYLYIAVRLEEEDIWATLTQHDSVIYMDNDFEVFLDPDSDSALYMEYEINAFGTDWDLLLSKPYRDKGRAIDSWEITGIQKGVDIKGTINDPSDKDQYWSVELAMPWACLMELYDSPNRKKKYPEDEIWRINFSRVQWDVDVSNGKYVKRKNKENGRKLPERNWVWSPQGLINMHYPERWGYVLFEGEHSTLSHIRTIDDLPDEKMKWVLWEIYYAQKKFFYKENRYTSSLKELFLDDTQKMSASKGVDLEAGERYFVARIQIEQVFFEVNEKGDFITRK